MFCSLSERCLNLDVSLILAWFQCLCVCVGGGGQFRFNSSQFRKYTEIPMISNAFQWGQCGIALWFDWVWNGIDPNRNDRKWQEVNTIAQTYLGPGYVDWSTPESSACLTVSFSSWKQTKCFSRSILTIHLTRSFSSVLLSRRAKSWSWLAFKLC